MADPKTTREPELPPPRPLAPAPPVAPVDPPRGLEWWGDADIGGGVDDVNDEGGP